MSDKLDKVLDDILQMQVSIKTTNDVLTNLATRVKTIEDRSGARPKIVPNTLSKVRSGKHVEHDYACSSHNAVRFDIDDMEDH